MSWEDRHLNEVEELIKKGAKKAYDENVMMCYEHTEFKSRMVEYLVVVNIAQLLMNWALPKYLQVHLEYPLADFYNGAFPTLKWCGNSIFDTQLFFRNEHNPEKNKSARIDIAITSEPFNEGHYVEPSYKSLIGIEVKSISKQKDTILKDIRRLSNSLALNDEIDNNNIKACYSLFYRRLDNYKHVNSKKELDNKKENEINRWKLILNKFRGEFKSLDYLIEPIVVQESTVDDIINQFSNEDQLDYAEVAEKSGLVMCYLIKIVSNAG